MRKVYLGLILAALFLIAACGQNETDGGPERVPVYEAEGGGQVSVPLPPHSQDYEPTGSETQLAEGPSVSVQPTLYPAPGTIVIVTEQALDQYVVAREIAHNHGADTVIHMSYTTPYWNNRAAYTAAMADAIIQDKAVRVLIINPSKDGDGLAALVRAKRSDIFIVYAGDSHVNAAMANLTLGVDMPALAHGFARQARHLGADTIVYFAPNVCESQCMEARNAVRTAADGLGLRFVEVIDHAEYIQCGSSLDNYLEEHVPMLMAEYGQNIVFAGLDDERLLWKFRTRGNIFPSTLFVPPTPQFIADALFVPSLQAMEREEMYNKNNAAHIIAETRHLLAEQNLLGRISAWAVSPTALFNYAAVEYGIKWMNGDVPYTGVDLAVLEQIMTGFIATYSGESGLGVSLTHSGSAVAVMMDYMTY